MKITTELLESLQACRAGIDLVASYPDKDPEAVIRRLVADDYWDWANWLLPRLMDYKGYVSYAVYAAELVLPIWEKKYPNDKRPRKAIEAAKRCIDNPSDENRLAADSRAAAWAAAARSAIPAAREAAWTAAAASAAAAAGEAAREAARSAADSHPAAWAAAAAAWAAAAAGEKNKSKILNRGLKILKLSKK